MKMEQKIAHTIINHGLDTPIVVAVCGAADLGKSYLSASIADALRSHGRVANHVTLDSFMMERAKRIACGLSGYQPEAYDFKSIENLLINFNKGEILTFFPYDHATGQKIAEPKTLPPGDVLLLDGLHSMHESLAPYIQISLFVYTNDDFLRSIRREADQIKRRQTLELSEKNEPVEFAKYKQFVDPYKGQATWHVFLKKKWEYLLVRNTAVCS